MNKLLIASDHAGFELKKKIIHTNPDRFEDIGPFEYEKNDDYPDFAEKVASQISHGKSNFGILICSSGVGMSIVANKFVGVRAALVNTQESVKLSREHNDANILVLSSNEYCDNCEQENNIELCLELINIFVSTPFSSEARHIQRIEKIKEIEKTNFK